MVPGFRRVIGNELIVRSWKSLSKWLMWELSTSIFPIEIFRNLTYLWSYLGVIYMRTVLCLMSTIRFVNIHCNYFDAILDTIYQKLSSLMPPCTICLKMQISAIIPSTCNVPHYWVGRVVGSPGNVPRRWFSYRIWPDAIYRDKPKLGKRWYRSYHQKIIFSGRGIGELPKLLPFFVAPTILALQNHRVQHAC